jgi:hypothetical protein
MRSQTSETIATIGWLLMDFCWTSEYKIPAYLCSSVALAFSFMAIFFYEDGKRSEKLLLLASLMWVTMNSFWMWGDFLKISWMPIVAKICFAITAFMIVLSIREARKEGESIDLKRLKIK